MTTVGYLDVFLHKDKQPAADHLDFVVSVLFAVSSSSSRRALHTPSTDLRDKLNVFPYDSYHLL